MQRSSAWEFPTPAHRTAVKETDEEAMQTTWEVDEGDPAWEPNEAAGIATWTVSALR